MAGGFGPSTPAPPATYERTPGAYARPETPAPSFVVREERSSNPAGLILGGGLAGAGLAALAGRFYWAAYWSTIEAREYIKVAARDWNEGVSEATVTGAIAGLVGGVVLGLMIALLARGGRGRRMKFGGMFGVLLAVAGLLYAFYLDRSDEASTGMAASYLFSGAGVAGVVGAALVILLLGPILGVLSGSDSSDSR